MKKLSLFATSKSVGTAKIIVKALNQRDDTDDTDTDAATHGCNVSARAPIVGDRRPKCAPMQLMPTHTLLQPIEAIEVGALVWTWDEASQSKVRRPVSQLFCQKSKPTLMVVCANESGAQETLLATNEHPFWVESKGWVSCAKLVSGDELKCIGSDAPMYIVKVMDAGHVVDVYNFEVNGIHNYFVSSVGILVHNSSGLREAPWPKWVGEDSSGTKFIPADLSTSNAGEPNYRGEDRQLSISDKLKDSSLWKELTRLRDVMHLSVRNFPSGMSNELATEFSKLAVKSKNSHISNAIVNYGKRLSDIHGFIDWHFELVGQAADAAFESNNPGWQSILSRDEVPAEAYHQEIGRIARASPFQGVNILPGYQMDIPYFFDKLRAPGIPYDPAFENEIHSPQNHALQILWGAERDRGNVNQRVWDPFAPAAIQSILSYDGDYMETSKLTMLNAAGLWGGAFDSMNGRSMRRPEEIGRLSRIIPISPKLSEFTPNWELLLAPYIRR